MNDELQTTVNGILTTHHLTIPEHGWRAAGDPTDVEEGNRGDERSLLTAELVINGTSHHLVAYQVDAAGHPVNDDHGETVDQYYAAAGALGQFESTTIGHRDYLVVLTPFD
jgi:hypothetical protein